MGHGPDREDFERRLLALVRDYMTNADERGVYPNGYEIDDFIIVYQILERIDDTEPLEAWETGPRHRAGFHSPFVAASSTTSNFWLDEAMLTAALASVRRRRDQAAADAAAGDVDENDGADELDAD